MFFDDLCSFSRFLGSGSGLKMLLGPARSFSRSRFLLNQFRLIFYLLGRPLYCVFLEHRDIVFLKDRDGSSFQQEGFLCLEDRDCCCSRREEFLYVARDRLLLFCNKNFSPNPSYLHSGEFVLPWDTKNRPSHTQIVHLEIMGSNVFEK